DTGPIIGEARVVLAADGQSSEIALSVADDWSRKGLGALLLEHLEAAARIFGARTLVGDVLYGNEPMRALARKSGFVSSTLPGDTRLARIVKDLSRAPHLVGERPVGQRLGE